MARVKGKFITLAGSFLDQSPRFREEADKALFGKTGKHWNELDPEGWYATEHLEQFMLAFSRTPDAREKAIVKFGRLFYPTVKKTTGIPPRVKTPLDYVKFESEGFLSTHKGAGVEPRKIIYAWDRSVLVEATAPGYSSKLFIGMYLGLLEMCGVHTGSVVQIKSQENGDKTSEFKITW